MAPCPCARECARQAGEVHEGSPRALPLLPAILPSTPARVCGGVGGEPVQCGSCGGPRCRRSPLSV